EPDQQRQGRHDLEVNDRAQPDDTDAAHIAYLGYASRDGGKDDHRHDGANEGDEAVAQRLHLDPEARIEMAEQDAQHYCDQNLDVKLPERRGASGRRRRPRCHVAGFGTAHKPLFPAQLSRILTMTLIASSVRSRANLIAMGTWVSGKVWVWIILASKRFCAISAAAR